MRQAKDNELTTRIHDFLDKKFTQFPELRMIALNETAAK